MRNSGILDSGDLEITLPKEVLLTLHAVLEEQNAGCGGAASIFHLSDATCLGLQQIQRFHLISSSRSMEDSSRHR